MTLIREKLIDWKAAEKDRNIESDVKRFVGDLNMCHLGVIPNKVETEMLIKK